MQNGFKSRIRMSISELGPLMERVEKFVEGRMLPAEAGFSLKLAVEEFITNQLKYSKGTFIEFEIAEYGADIKLIFSDDGIEFDPLSADKPDVQSHPGEREIGGLGIHLVKAMSRSLKYRRDNGINILEVCIKKEK